MQLNVKLNRFEKVILIMLHVGIVLGMYGCGSMENNILNKLEINGYNVEIVDNNSFFITEDGVDYYFDTIFNKITLKKIIVTVTAKEEINHLINNEGKITITKLGKNKTSVLLTTNYTDENNEGKEFVTTGNITIAFKGSFTEEDITNNHGFHDTISDYHYVTSYFLSADELQNLYDKALELEDEIK